MQVSIACTDHNLKGRNGDHGKTNATSPNVVNAARAKFRTVAIIARSFGSFTPRHHISLKESTGKLTGMKYRILVQTACHQGLIFCMRAQSHLTSHCSTEAKKIRGAKTCTHTHIKSD
ncbi:Voltage-gated potassium channel subunit beta-1 [Anabarilius grahami]|uniref:Voltage-gated potassium channel subunit beta-1 n=1 Tax=Anabarilius grahami TaxID=495550 RepID=A0A3N0XSB3_ANAGA|nr:Voltage-gated potassium channel subunit beta-1 [Anabarilius grahami]